MFYNINLKLFLDSVEDSILTLIIEFSIKSYVSPEFFSSAQKFSLKRYFDRREILVKFCSWAHIWLFYNIKCFYEVNLVQISLKKDFKNFFVT